MLHFLKVDSSMFGSDNAHCENTFQKKLEKVAISNALPLEATHSASHVLL